MHKLTRVLAYAATTSVIGLGVAASPASADDIYYRGCTTTGAFGDLQVSGWYSGTTSVGVWFDVADTLSDGHAVEVRIIGRNQVNTLIAWPWHKISTGYATSHAWASTASYSDGLYDVGLEVARLSGSTKILNYCTDTVDDEI